jgi:ATP-dependent Clp protease ATP-binding subunit ClpA
VNGYNFTETARRVLTEARNEAVRLKHEQVGTEHILIALLRDPNDAPGRVVSIVGAQPADVITALEVASVSNATKTRDDLPFSSPAKKVLELAMKEERLNKHDYVGTEHLLVGVLAEERGIGAQVLRDKGVSLAAARSELARLSPAFASIPTPPHDRSGDFTTHNASTRLLAALARSEVIARERCSTTIGPEHVALALAASRGGRVMAALMMLGVDQEALVPALEANAPRGDGNEDSSVARPTHPSLRAILNTLRPHGRRDGEVTTDQLLLAILDTHPATAAAFASCGVTAASLRDALEAMDG